MKRFPRAVRTTWQYLAYPPQYDHQRGHVYTRHRSLAVAKATGLSLGIGARVVRWRTRLFVTGQQLRDTPEPGSWRLTAMGWRTE